MGVTIRQIAEAAGVSRGTVDRALNNRGRINPQVKERIEQIARDMGYRPNQLGRALSMSRNNRIIGVILQSVETPFMQELRQGIEKARQEVEVFGVTVLLREIKHVSAADTIRALEALRAAGACAIALTPLEEDSVKQAIQKLVREDEIPVVTFNSDLADTGRLCFVGQNAYQCGRAAAGLMGELVGKTGTVAVISGYRTNPSQSERVRGFFEEMEARYPQTKLLEPQYCLEEQEKAAQIANALLDQCPNLSGIYMTSHGEEGVCGVLEARNAAGKIKMIANDFMGNNYDLMRKGDIQFLIGQDARIQGYEPVMILFRYLLNGELPRRERLYTDIYIRNVYVIPDKKNE